jgi:hypothetical protein
MLLGSLTCCSHCLLPLLLLSSVLGWVPLGLLVKLQQLAVLLQRQLAARPAAATPASLLLLQQQAAARRPAHPGTVRPAAALTTQQTPGSVATMAASVSAQFSMPACCGCQHKAPVVGKTLSNALCRLVPVSAAADDTLLTLLVA